MNDSERFKLEKERQRFTMLIAGLVIVGGMLQIFTLLWLQIISGETGVTLLAALLSSALAWLFTKDAGKDGAKANQEASAQGAAQALAPYPSPQPPEQP